jgi:5-methylcytosine-specific restriction endonuclease McrA
VWTPTQSITGWGFVTEKATVITYEDNPRYLHKIQKLVDAIWEKTRLKFWDCHEHNVGYIKRGHAHKLVCIDTGKESFDGNANAWANPDPGPKCSYCEKYECNCSD